MLPRQDLFELIVESLGLKDLSTAEQGEIINGLQDNILSAINVAILEKLSETDREELLQLEAKNEPGAVERFIQTKITNLQELMREVAVATVEDFKRRRG